MPRGDRLLLNTARVDHDVTCVNVLNLNSDAIAFLPACLKTEIIPSSLLTLYL